MRCSKIFVFLLILCFALISMCTSKKTIESISDNNDSNEQTLQKQKIKAFWDIYRLAQKNRVNGQWQEAVTNYESALEIDSDHEDARFNLGNVYLELFQYKKAEACWLTIIENNPKSARTHMQLGRLYFSYERPETFDIAKAKQEFLTTSEINKVVTGPLMLLGHVALIEGADKTAITYLQSVVGSDTKNVEAYFLLGYIHWKTKNLGSAKQMLEKAIEHAAPEKAVKGVLSEGDTKDGVSFLRPINESIFQEYVENLHQLQNQDLQPDEHYQALDQYVDEIKNKI